MPRHAALLCGIGLLWLACAADGPGGRFSEAGDYELEIEHDGLGRRYLLHLPPGWERELLPVVISFHGGGGRAQGHKDWTRMDRLADRERFAIVYPDGTGGVFGRLLTFNAGGCCGPARRRNVDDVGFAIALLEDLARDLPLDRRRVYATGMSNGAMMSYRLAAEAAQHIAAIAPVGAAMSLDRFAPARPVPVMHIHSVDDPRALYDGGLGPPFPLTRSRVLHKSVEAELARWVERNGCAAEPRQVSSLRAPESRFDSGHTAAKLVWSPCSSGAEVVLWKLAGAGHVWPGTERNPWPRVLGRETAVIDANEEMWRFFSRFSRPDAPPLRR